MEKNGEESEAWDLVMIGTLFSDVKGSWHAIRAKLELAAAEVNVVMLRRESEDKEKFLAKSGRGFSDGSKREKHHKRTFIDLTYGGGSDNKHDFLWTPKRFPTNPQHLPTPPWTPANSHAKGSKKPESPSKDQVISPSEPVSSMHWVPWNDYRYDPPDLAFRFWDDESHGLNSAQGFCAGAFIQPRFSIPLPTPRKTSAFKHQVENHLRPYKKPSQYISIWGSLIPALHRCLRSKSNAQVAVINLRGLSEIEMAGGLPKIHSSAALIRRLDMRRSDWTYKGEGEWLIFAVIPQEFVLTTFSAKDLREYIGQNPLLDCILRLTKIEQASGAYEYGNVLKKTQQPLSKAAGEVIGRFLAFIKLPRPSLTALAIEIARKWMFLGSSSKQRIGSYLVGVNRGFQGLSNPSLGSLNGGENMEDAIVERAAREPANEDSEEDELAMGATVDSRIEQDIDEFIVKRKRILSALQRQDWGGRKYCW